MSDLASTHAAFFFLGAFVTLLFIAAWLRAHAREIEGFSRQARTWKRTGTRPRARRH